MGAPGCDDAPEIDVPWGKQCKLVTFVYPYYENPLFLARQLKAWAAYPASLREFLSFIVVDDGSPLCPAEGVIRECAALNQVPERLRLFRIGVDVRWNWLAARNVGAHHADDDWLLLTDMDHMVPLWTVRALVSGVHDPRVIYRPARREHTSEPIHAHPNSWFMTRRMFWKVGGYDEALSGHYGTDAEYRRRCAATAPIRIMRNAELVRHEYVADSSTTHYKRKEERDRITKHMIRARGPDWKPKVLTFPYAEIDLSAPRVRDLPVEGKRVLSPSV